MINNKLAVDRPDELDLKDDENRIYHLQHKSIVFIIRV